MLSETGRPVATHVVFETPIVDVTGAMVLRRCLSPIPEYKKGHIKEKKQRVQTFSSW